MVVLVEVVVVVAVSKHPVSHTESSVSEWQISTWHLSNCWPTAPLTESKANPKKKVKNWKKFFWNSDSEIPKEYDYLTLICKSIKLVRIWNRINFEIDRMRIIFIAHHFFSWIPKRINFLFIANIYNFTRCWSELQSRNGITIVERYSKIDWFSNLVLSICGYNFIKIDGIVKTL